MVVTEAVRDVRDTVVRFFEELAGHGHAAENDMVRKHGSGLLLEDAGQIVRIEVERIGNVLPREFLQDMVLDEVLDLPHHGRFVSGRAVAGFMHSVQQTVRPDVGLLGRVELRPFRKLFPCRKHSAHLQAGFVQGAVDQADDAVAEGFQHFLRGLPFTDPVQKFMDAHPHGIHPPRFQQEGPFGKIRRFQRAARQRTEIVQLQDAVWLRDVLLFQPQQILIGAGHVGKSRRRGDITRQMAVQVRVAGFDETFRVFQEPVQRFCRIRHVNDGHLAIILQLKDNAITVGHQGLGGHVADGKPHDFLVAQIHLLKPLLHFDEDKDDLLGGLHGDIQGVEHFLDAA